MIITDVGKTLKQCHKPTMTGTGKHTTYNNGDLGGWFMALFYPHYPTALDILDNIGNIRHIGSSWIIRILVGILVW